MHTACRRGVLLVNLGSPDSPCEADVRRYLEEFLSDAKVLDMPAWARTLLLRAIILPFRPKKSAAAYREIWASEGSPLVVTTRKVCEKLQEVAGMPVACAMRYGNPSIESALEHLKKQGVRRLLLVPLYPHYAMSSYETVVEKVAACIKKISPEMDWQTVPPFYDEPLYIRALVESAKPFLDGGYQKLIFSFHGVPERHIRKGDITGSHCLAKPGCCEEVGHPAHARCYRMQTRATVRAFIKASGWPEEKCEIVYQSRFGLDRWIQPPADEVLRRLPSEGVREIALISPAFVADCLETLEEMAIRGREIFIGAGGTRYTVIPCLNEHPFWIEALAGYVKKWGTDGCFEKE